MPQPLFPWAASNLMALQLAGKEALAAFKAIAFADIRTIRFY